VFAKIAMPLATPVIALVGFFNFTGNWNNYFLPYVTLPGRKAPIQVGLAELLSNVPAFNPTNAASTTISLSALALATLLAIAPVMIVFLFAQRYLVSGMTAGGTKE
jgi:multiple sugar transport system permease protein